MSAAERDPMYYWDTVVFRVEDRLYKVPRYYFENHSEIFGSTFGLPRTEKTASEGQSDDNPFCLPGITAKEFDCLLRIIYPMKPEGDSPTYSISDWRAVLKLSTMWGMSSTRQSAIQNLGRLATSDPVDAIVLAKTYDVPEWLRSGYIELVKRVQPISVDEAQLIGAQSAIQLFHIREAALVKQAGHRGYVKYTGTLLDNDVIPMIELVFEEEFEKANAATQRHLNPSW
ncbi:hypothetical protein CYLTODRAFT_491994 [Cylindrobasidium torrendii FP15055 ss-10]|uniref:BTB domain-containing protein n=1 Tax=Cylindrobasidium torrendii FP15055 ss-10 TaxID=1314674 RepID=A0A0D7B6L2_9AGAR|nr:hypothetical protein CYLTODRAFT_491994 [Cylindrobasidium torrendii FP15055 ss-10]